MAILTRAVKDVSARDEQVRLEAIWWLRSPAALELGDLLGYDLRRWARGVERLTAGQLDRAA